MKKRFLGFLMAISFAVSSFSVDVYAGEYSELDAEEAIEETAEDVDVEISEEDEEYIEDADNDEEDSAPFEHFTSLGGYSISFSADPGVLPDNTETSISIISETDSGKDIEDIVKNEIDEDKEILRIITFDITFISEGTVIEPEEGSVNVAISMDSSMEQAVAEAEDTYEEVSLEVFHIEDSDTAQAVDSELADGKDIVFDATEFSPYSVVLTASKASYYTIHFDGNNCTIGSMEDMDECKVGTEYVLTRNSFSRDYSIFTGWNTRSDGTGTAYADCATVKNLAITDGDTVTLYAQWEFIPEDCNHYVHFGEESFFPKYVITKEATSTEWGEAQEICEICGEVLNTVQIHPYETYTVAFSAGDTVTVTGWFDHDYAREVFNLASEYRRENGLNTLVYNDGCQDASDIRALETSVYYSHTRPDGRSWRTVSDSWTHGAENIAIGQNNPNVVMAAWKKSPGHNDNLLYGIKSGDTPIQGLSVGCFHCISFDPETGEPTETISWGQQFTFSGIESVDPTETCIISQPENTTASVGETVTFNVVAQNVSEYKWYYSPNGSTWNVAESSSDMTGSGTNTLSVTVKNSEFYNYLFKCVIWDNNSQQFTTDSVHIGDPEQIKIYVTRFNENDGTAHPDTTDMTCIIGQSFTLKANSFTRDGLIFNGWNTKPDGTGTYYADQAQVKDLTTKDQGLVILYAQWANDSYRIQYFGNGSNGGYMDDWIVRNYGITYTLDANAYTRNGYHFTGWNTRADGRGTSYADRGQINLSFVPGSNRSSNVFRLYAQWKKDRYTIAYNLNGGTNSDENPSSYSVTSATITLADPIKDNYTFGGWFSDSGFSTRVKTIGYGSTGNMTLYAKWNVIPSQPSQPSQPEQTDGNSVEVDETKAFVSRLYVVCLGREAEEEGLNQWASQLKSGEKKAVDIVQGVLCSPEYMSKGKTNEQIVTDCYNAMLGRNPDQDGFVNWVTRLDSGMSINAIFAGFVGSSEFAALCAQYNISPGVYPITEERDKNAGVTQFVGRLYTKALGRNYDVKGLNDWCRRINDDTSRNNILSVATNGFFHSQEFLNKNLSNEDFVRVCYRTYLGREPEPAGFSDWVGQLNRGEKDRDRVMEGFAFSSEFGNIMEQYGL